MFTPSIHVNNVLCVFSGSSSLKHLSRAKRKKEERTAIHYGHRTAFHIYSIERPQKIDFLKK
jgi:hypothetical protein